MSQKPANAPICFPDPQRPNDPLLHSAQATECTGGFDAAYTNPVDGSHRRERCAWYANCAQATTSERSRRTQLVQIRPGTFGPVPQPALPPIQQPGFRPGTVPQQMQMQYPQQIQPQYPQYQMQPQQQYQQPQYAAPYVAQYGPMLVPVPMQQPGAQMHAYLSAPEPIDPTEHWFKRLSREVARSMAKSSGHTAAHFFDHNPWKLHEPPKGGNQGG